MKSPQQIAEWRPIVGYEGFYEISSTGLVRGVDRFNNRGRTLRAKVISPTLQRQGYLQLRLWKNAKVIMYKVHRLVALAFLPNENNFETVNHKDGVKLNNNVENLEWCTRLANMEHATKMGLMKKRKGVFAPMAKLNDEKVLIIRKGELPVRELAEKYGVTVSCIKRVKQRRSWTHI